MAGALVELGEVKTGRAQGGNINSFLCLKVCCEKHAEQMFSVFTEHQTTL